jgi:hypothetical protein
MRLRNFVSCARKNSVFSWLCSLFLFANQHFLICLEIDKNPVFLKFLIKQFTLTLKKKLKNAFVQSLSDNIISNKFLFTENKKVYVILKKKLIICKNIYIYIYIFFQFQKKKFKMGNKVTRTDFVWSDQEEPHAKRRVEILSKTI